MWRRNVFSLRIHKYKLNNIYPVEIIQKYWVTGNWRLTNSDTCEGENVSRILPSLRRTNKPTLYSGRLSQELYFNWDAPLSEMYKGRYLSHGNK